MNPYQHMDPEERSLRAQVAAHESWAQTTDRQARIKPALDGQIAKFAREADPDGVMSPEQRAAAARNRQLAHMARMRLARATKARRARQDSEPPHAEDVA